MKNRNLRSDFLVDKRNPSVRKHYYKQISKIVLRVSTS